MALLNDEEQESIGTAAAYILKVPPGVRLYAEANSLWYTRRGLIT